MVNIHSLKRPTHELLIRRRFEPPTADDALKVEKVKLNINLSLIKLGRLSNMHDICVAPY
jgi:hypothetical protein